MSTRRLEDIIERLKTASNAKAERAELVRQKERDSALCRERVEQQWVVAQSLVGSILDSMNDLLGTYGVQIHRWRDPPSPRKAAFGSLSFGLDRDGIEGSKRNLVITASAEGVINVHLEASRDAPQKNYSFPLSAATPAKWERVFTDLLDLHIPKTED